MAYGTCRSAPPASRDGVLDGSWAVLANTREATIIKKTVATGSVVPRKEVQIKPQVSGIVDKLHVEAGDEVRQGAEEYGVELREHVLFVADALRAAFPAFPNIPEAGG